MAATKAELIAYIRQAAQARGIDPNVAVKVARSEGLNANPADGWQSTVVKNGKRETSYGPYQLLVGGGLGDGFIAATGKSPKDPSTVFQQIDYALDYAAQNGWGSWYGAKAVGLSNRAGLANAQPIGIQAGASVASAPPIPITRPASYDPAQTQSLMAALGVQSPQVAQTMPDLGQMLAFNETPQLTPAQQAAADQANVPPVEVTPEWEQWYSGLARQLGIPQSSVDTILRENTVRAGDAPMAPAPPEPPTSNPVYAASPIPDLTQPGAIPNPKTPDDYAGTGGATSVPGATEWRQKADSALADALANPPKPGSYFEYPDLATMQPEFPIGGRPSWADPSLPYSASTDRAMAQRSGVPSGQGGIGSDANFYAAPTPRAVATTSVGADPQYANDAVIAAMDNGSPAPSRSYNPFDPSNWNPVGSAEAAPAQITVHPQSKMAPTPAGFQDFPKTPSTANYTALAGSAIPTAQSLGFGLGGINPITASIQPPAAPPVVQPVTPPDPKARPVVAAPRPVQPRIPAVPIARLGSQLGNLLSGGALRNGLANLLGGGNVLPTKAGMFTSPGNVYSTPSGANFDVTPGSHGSYMVTGNGTIMSPSQYIDAMQGSGGWY